MTLRGINFSGDMKFPINGSYLNSMPLEEADIHLARIRSLGFNTLRFIFTWDALEHEGPGIYDQEYIQYVVKMLQKCKSHGFYVFMDPHQDVWSRHTGGSGAPLWTLHAAGINPDNLEATSAALFGEKHPDVKMIWAANYHRLACQIMFTVFYAGHDFLPKLEINGENLQYFLERHYFNAVKKLALAIAETDPTLVIGWESLNEPGHGLIGYFNLGLLPQEHQHVKLGPTATPFQGMILANGQKQVVDYFLFTSMGVKKHGTQTIDPKGQSLWLPHEKLNEIDHAYGWERNWDGGCIFKLHGIYEETSPQKTPRLLLPLYFTHSQKYSNVKITETTFVDRYFAEQYARYRSIIRNIYDEWLLFLQPPVNCEPPNVHQGKCTVSDIIDDKTVYAPHYYDGLTLMLQEWRFFNVDALGVIRNKYSNPPIMALRVGGPAIRQSLKHQLAYLKNEGQQILNHKLPVMITEIGIPFNIHQSCFVRAMDANCHALEKGNIHHTLWVYVQSNTLKDGDNWNGENLSIFCRDLQKQAADPSNLSNGIRAIEALARPYPISITGQPLDYGFDIKSATFSCKIKFSNQSTPTAQFALPEFYFPKDNSENTTVTVSNGTWKIHDNSLIWTPDKSGVHAIQIKTLPKYAHPPCAIS